MKNPRIGDNPLVVKAIDVTGNPKATAVLSDEDGVKLHTANRCNRILERGRVVFLVAGGGTEGQEK